VASKQCLAPTRSAVLREGISCRSKASVCVHKQQRTATESQSAEDR
jgi:hypothetical protein